MADIDEELDDISTYKGLLDTIHKFADRLARQAADLDRQVKNFGMLPASQHDILASTLENFIYTVVKVKENQLRADERERINAAQNRRLEDFVRWHNKRVDTPTITFEILNEFYDNIAKEIRGEGHAHKERS